jgi:hypothetical protein
MYLENYKGIQNATKNIFTTVFSLTQEDNIGLHEAALFVV